MEDYEDMDSVVFGIPDAIIPPDKTKMDLAKQMIDFLKKNGIEKAVSLGTKQISELVETIETDVGEYDDENDDINDMDFNTSVLFETITDKVYSFTEKENFEEMDIYDEMYYAGVTDGQNLMMKKIFCALFKLKGKNKLNHDFDDLVDELNDTVAGMDNKQFDKLLKKMTEYTEGKENG